MFSNKLYWLSIDVFCLLLFLILVMYFLKICSLTQIIPVLISVIFLIFSDASFSSVILVLLLFLLVVLANLGYYAQFKYKVSFTGSVSSSELISSTTNRATICRRLWRLWTIWSGLVRKGSTRKMIYSRNTRPSNIW